MLVDLVTPPQNLCLEFRDDHAPRKPGEPISGDSRTSLGLGSTGTISASKQADFDDSLDGSHPRSFLERIELQESGVPPPPPEGLFSPAAKTEGKDACDSGDKRSLPALRPHALPPKEENGGVALRCPWTLVCTTSLPYPPSQPSG
ncbi:hypothetical protein R6Z07F_011306 [Ovis aries]